MNCTTNTNRNVRSQIEEKENINTLNKQKQLKKIINGGQKAHKNGKLYEKHVQSKVENYFTERKSNTEIFRNGEIHNWFSRLEINLQTVPNKKYYCFTPDHTFIFVKNNILYVKSVEIKSQKTTGSVVQKLAGMKLMRSCIQDLINQDINKYNQKYNKNIAIQFDYCLVLNDYLIKKTFRNENNRMWNWLSTDFNNNNFLVFNGDVENFLPNFYNWIHQ